MKNIFYLCILLLVFTNCKKEPEIPFVFDYGTTNLEEGSYYNSFFDLKFFFNPAWHISKQMKSTDIVSSPLPKNLGGGEVLPEGQIAAYRIKTAHLLAIFKYKEDYKKDVNPYIVIMVDNLNKFSDPELKTTQEYINFSKKHLKKLIPTCKFAPTKNVIIDEQQFKFLKTTIDAGAIGSVYQECYSIQKNGFFLNIIFSYRDEKDKYEFNEILKHIKL